MSASSSSFPVRLLSSVAVVGRDNEPIYLRGSLSDSIFSSSTAAPPPSTGNNNDNNNGYEKTTPASAEERADWSGSDNEEERHNNNSIEEGGESSSTADENSPSKPGLFGRIKGAVIRKNEEGDTITGEKPQHDSGGSSDTDGIDENDDDDDDPFGFFGRSTDIDTTSKGVVSAPMSLTQQLVLHASLDRFEEKMAARSKTGGPARWRSPGAMGTNAMWMGMLCEVEERMSLYGYTSNTGIKFILLLEVTHVNEDGSRCQDGSPSSLYASSTVTSLPSREAELKTIFAQLHDLYVRYTMNPFTKLRGPIKSGVFDSGIGEIARAFNSSAIEQAVQSGEANGEGLAW
eukprot:CAMPEP_0201688752 /NCGR_PEP_ID=MMETSP0578-20130828/2470_1 /ASSEMBLY_ACC=CAM_ASM_000663 /TAXON_ID=267565 /ORGANISM="Skeletonema grethea, Strain CCMP 1804" /LENGTH=345 /DNA_ID=CAMNT_0048173193 /DNA_START=66 /DNA_END=1100 /DNA_ORIENTATION=-